MLGDIKIFNMASALARHSAERHSVISENIANADTRNYKAKDLEAFDTAYARQVKSGVSASSGELRPTHTMAWRAYEMASDGSHSPNGNTVSLEDQITRSVKAQADHDAAATIYKKALDILRMSLGRNL